MDISEFRKDLIEQVKFASFEEGITDGEAFLNISTEMLKEAEVIEDFTALHFEGLGRHNRKIQINGYEYNELDDCLSIFIVPPLSYFANVTLTTSDAEVFLTRARSFIADSSYIIEKAEPAAPGYGLALDIQQQYKDVRKYNIYLLTDMLMSNNLKQITTDNLNGKQVEFSIWDIGRLFQIYSSKTGKEEIIIRLNELFGNGIQCLLASKTDDYTAYLCNMPGMYLASLYNQYGARLLEGNVRSFLQTKGKVNKGIRNTILNNPGMFFAYNNGIAATADSIELEEVEGKIYVTEISSFQIVNGGQTTASLAMALLNDSKDGSEQKINNINVPMKLSVVTHDKAQELIPNISRFANSQNKVTEADLWSNHPFHIRMEDFSRRIVAPATEGRQYGTHWYYERANGQYKQETYKLIGRDKKNFELLNPKNQMFKKIDLAKYMNIFQMRPDIASTGGQKGFVKFAEWVNKEWENHQEIFNEEYFKDIIALAIINMEADKIVGRQAWYNSYKANIVAYTTAKIFYVVNTECPKYAISLKNIWSKQTLTPAWVTQIEYTSEIMYRYLINETRLVENVTEWAKREICWEQAKEIKIILNQDFINELIDKGTLNEDKLHAKKEQKNQDRAQAMIDVVNYGVKNWKELLEWDKTHNVLNHVDIDFVNLAISTELGRTPTDKQAVRIMDVLEKARNESFPL